MVLLVGLGPGYDAEPEGHNFGSRKKLPRDPLSLEVQVDMRRLATGLQRHSRYLQCHDFYCARAFLRQCCLYLVPFTTSQSISLVRIRSGFETRSFLNFCHVQAFLRAVL